MYIFLLINLGIFINLGLVLTTLNIHLDISLGEIKSLERKGRKLLGLLKENLLQADRTAKFIVNKPDLVEINNGYDLLALLDRV